MSMMLKSLNIDPEVLGYDVEEGRWRDWRGAWIAPGTFRVTVQRWSSCETSSQAKRSAFLCSGICTHVSTIAWQVSHP